MHGKSPVGRVDQYLHLSVRTREKVTEKGGKGEEEKEVCFGLRDEILLPRS